MPEKSNREMIPCGVSVVVIVVSFSIILKMLYRGPSTQGDKSETLGGGGGGS